MGVQFLSPAPLCLCGCSSMVELQPSKLITWVRFPSPAPLIVPDTAGVAELADATDLKSVGWKQPYRFDSGPRHQLLPCKISSCGRGGMADALASGASDGNIMEVQVLSTAPFKFSSFLQALYNFIMRSWRNWQTRYFEGVVFTRRMGSSPIDRTICLKRYLVLFS